MLSPRLQRKSFFPEDSKMAPSLDYPKLLTELPGPKARKVLAKDKKFISPSYTRGYPLVIHSGDGVIVTDVDGNIFLDFTAGIAVCNTGHRHPDVVKAVIDQANAFLHMSGTDFYYSIQS
jgi:4-aminobutyrate aminotransferase